MVKDKRTIVGIGAELTNLEEEVTISIKDEDRAGHLWCFGTTRVGKTRIEEHMIEQDIRKGYSVVCLDPQGDKDLLSKIIQVAFEEERQEELILITPIFTHCSAIIDPMAYYYMPEELVGHIVAGIEIGKEKFFYNVAYEISLVIVQSLLMIANIQGNKKGFNLNEVKNWISHEAIGERLLLWGR